MKNETEEKASSSFVLSVSPPLCCWFRSFAGFFVINKNSTHHHHHFRFLSRSYTTVHNHRIASRRCLRITRAAYQLHRNFTPPSRCTFLLLVLPFALPASPLCRLPRFSSVFVNVDIVKQNNELVTLISRFWSAVELERFV